MLSMWVLTEPLESILFKINFAWNSLHRGQNCHEPLSYALKSDTRPSLESMLRDSG